MSARLGLLLSLSGVPSYDHLLEKPRTGFRIKTEDNVSVIRFQHPTKLPIYCLEEHRQLMAMTTQVLAKAHIEYGVEGRTVRVPSHKKGGQVNVPLFTAHPPKPRSANA